MNNNVNYTLVGALVIFGISLMISFGYWLLKPSSEQEMKKYSIHFDESVLGLNIDAPVKYRGINVGKVSKLRINPNNSEQVEVLVNILKSTPIKSDTVAKLTSQGITGLSYINLSLGTNNSEELKVKEGEEYPLIKTTPSLFLRLESSFGNVSDSLSNTLLKTQELLNEENQKQFALLLANTAKSMNRVNEILNEQNQKEIASLIKSTNSLMGKMDKLLDDESIKNLQETMSNLNHASSQLDAMMPLVKNFFNNSIEWEDKLSASFVSITGSYFKISESMVAFKKAVAGGEFNLKEISSDLIPTMNQTFIEIQQLMIKLEEAVNQYERSPGDILFKQEKVKKGPGEN